MDIEAYQEIENIEQPMEDSCGVVDDEQIDVDDAELTDNWIEGVDETDSINTSEQEIISTVLTKCRTLTLLIKRSVILTTHFDSERKKLSIRRNLSLDLRTR